MNSVPFNRFVDLTEEKLDEYVVSGSDEELFIASYLHGHFSLAVSQTLQSQKQSTDELNKVMQANLQSAFDNNELESSDQKKVFAMWSSLIN